jgi:hypothetical protein
VGLYKKRLGGSDHAPLPKMRDHTRSENNRVGKLSRLPELSEVRGSCFYSEVFAGRVSAREDGLAGTLLPTDIYRPDALFHESDQ